MFNAFHLTVAVVLLVTSVAAATLWVNYRKAEQCEAQGGKLLRTNSGLICAKIESIPLQ